MCVLFLDQQYQNGGFLSLLYAFFCEFVLCSDTILCVQSEDESNVIYVLTCAVVLQKAEGCIVSASRALKVTIAHVITLISIQIF